MILGESRITVVIVSERIRLGILRVSRCLLFIAVLKRETLAGVASVAKAELRQFLGGTERGGFGWSRGWIVGVVWMEMGVFQLTELNGEI